MVGVEVAVLTGEPELFGLLRQQLQIQAEVMMIALLERDYPMVSCVNLVFATGVLVINLVVDMLYGFLDPRVRYA